MRGCSFQTRRPRILESKTSRLSPFASIEGSRVIFTPCIYERDGIDTVPCCCVPLPQCLVTFATECNIGTSLDVSFRKCRLSWMQGVLSPSCHSIFPQENVEHFAGFEAARRANMHTFSLMALPESPGQHQPKLSAKMLSIH